jgi:hypothetical protein
LGAYIPLIIWLISGLICFVIANKRGIRTRLGWNLLIVFLGPFAIPLLFLARPEKE